jgi:hypothetical protein
MFEPHTIDPKVIGVKFECKFTKLYGYASIVGQNLRSE